MARDDLEFHFYEYLYRKAYSRPEALEETLRFYLPLLEGYTHVLDIGCGRGEFLELLQEAGHVAVGVDRDSAMVEACRTKQLDAVEADVLEWLQSQSSRFDAIFCTNVVEHLTPSRAAAMISSAYDALRPGGRILLATPNPESIIVHLCEFWRDPTHVRLYNRQLLEFFLSRAGFTGIASHQNDAARWEGIDTLLAPLPEGGRLATRTSPTVPEDARPPRLWTRLLRPAAGWLRRATDHDRSIQQAIMDQQSRLDESLARLERTERQIRQLVDAYRFLFPSREVCVYGTRPMAEQEGAAQP